MMHSFYGSYGALSTSPFGGVGFGIFGLLLLAVLALKGYALWHAARRSEKWWFIALLIINTMGILELIYLIFIVGKWHHFKNTGTPPASSTATPPTAAPKA
jgi:hypothetical protein